MENLTEVQKQVKRYETAFGSLPEKTPYDSSVKYLTDDWLGSTFELFPDGKYVANLRIKFEETIKNDYVYYMRRGNYFFKPQELTLTLVEESREIGSPYKNLEEIVSKLNNSFSTLIEKHYPKEYSIPNFTWISSVIQLPDIVLSMPKPDSSELDIESSRLINVELRADHKYGFNFKYLTDLVETLNTKKTDSASGITEPAYYEYLTLNPDGTLYYKNCSESWDRDGSYTWDSSFKYEGKWDYDAEKRIMRITYKSFLIDDNGKNLDPSQFGLEIGKVDETHNFYFEANYIRAVSTNFNFSTPVDVGTRPLKKGKLD